MKRSRSEQEQKEEKFVPSKRLHVSSTLVQKAIDYKLDGVEDFKWSDSQLNIIKLVEEKKNIYLTGNAGSGKSTLINFLKRSLPSRTTFVTASTGISALHLDGTTIYTFVGAGLASGSVEQCVSIIRRNPMSRKRWANTKVLIIDEISMINGALFDKFNYIGQVMRGNGAPFGGIQLIVVGDFMQLPPVNKEGGYAFQATTWKSCFHQSCRLGKVFRQTDKAFVDVLDEVRYGQVSRQSIKLLESRLDQPAPDETVVETKLFARKQGVSEYNNSKLQALDIKTERTFKSKDTCKKATDLKALNKLQAMEELRIRKGAHVMLIWNLDLSRGLCNGSQGIVTDFKMGEGGIYFPYVHFQNGEQELIVPMEWEIKKNKKVVAKRRQLPLLLAWAITIHKSQGMSIDRAAISLSSCFDIGQVYVALSRVRTLEGIRLLSFDPRKIVADAYAIEFDKDLL